MNLWKRGYVLGALFVVSFFLAGATPQGNEPGKEKDSNSSQSPETGSKKKEELKGDPAKGKEVFEASCALCHNADSEEAKIGPGLKGLFQWPPHKLSDGTEHKEHTVEIIRKQIVEGGGAMDPVGGSFTEQELSDLIAYLHTL